MTDNDPEVDLDVSGPTATAIAGSILSICEEATDPSSVLITLSHGGSTVSIGGDGREAVEIVPKMVSSVDWQAVGLDSINVQLTSADDSPDRDEEFERPESPSVGDRISPWEQSDGGITPVRRDSNYYAALEYVAENGATKMADLVEGMVFERDYASSILSDLFAKKGLLDRARYYNGSGGLSYTYRVNDHGHAVLNS